MPAGVLACGSFFVNGGIERRDFRWAGEVRLAVGPLCGDGCGFLAAGAAGPDLEILLLGGDAAAGV